MVEIPKYDPSDGIHLATPGRWRPADLRKLADLLEAQQPDPPVPPPTLVDRMLAAFWPDYRPFIPSVDGRNDTYEQRMAAVLAVVRAAVEGLPRSDHYSGKYGLWACIDRREALELLGGGSDA